MLPYSAELIQPLADERGIQVHCDLAPAKVSSDSTRINQIIINLVTNAIQYNKSQGEIRIGTRAENGSVVLTVADTGQGIAPEDQPHIFERFYRGDKSRSRAGACSGLGFGDLQSHRECQWRQP